MNKVESGEVEECCGTGCCDDVLLDELSAAASRKNLETFEKSAKTELRGTNTEIQIFGLVDPQLISNQIRAFKVTLSDISSVTVAANADILEMIKNLETNKYYEVVVKFKTKQDETLHLIEKSYKLSIYDEFDVDYQRCRWGIQLSDELPITILFTPRQNGSW